MLLASKQFSDKVWFLPVYFNKNTKSMQNVLVGSNGYTDESKINLNPS